MKIVTAPAPPKAEHPRAPWRHTRGQFRRRYRVSAWSPALGSYVESSIATKREAGRLVRDLAADVPGGVVCLIDQRTASRRFFRAVAS